MKFRRLLTVRMLHAIWASRCPAFRPLLRCPARPAGRSRPFRGRRALLPDRTDRPSCSRAGSSSDAFPTAVSDPTGLSGFQAASDSPTDSTPRDTALGPDCMRCRLPGAGLSPRLSPGCPGLLVMPESDSRRAFRSCQAVCHRLVSRHTSGWKSRRCVPVSRRPLARITSWLRCIPGANQN